MPHDDDKSEWKGCLYAVNIAARVFTMALAVASAALMVTASQCPVVLPNGAEAHTVTYSDFDSFVLPFTSLGCVYILTRRIRECRYLVVANTIAAFMVGWAICLSVWKKGSSKLSSVLLPLLDFATPALLYSSIGDASDYISCSTHGGGHISDCDGTVRTNNFCSQVHKAMYISRLAAVGAGGVSAAVLVKNAVQFFGGAG